MQVKRPIIVLLILSVPVVVAADGFNPAARARAIGPFIDEQTIGVAHADLSRGSATGTKAPRLDLDALESWCTGVLELVQPDTQERRYNIAQLREARTAAGKWITDFTRAGGAEIFVVISLADALDRGTPFLVIPLASGADAGVIIGLLRDGTADAAASESANTPAASRRGTAAEQIGNAVVAGSAETLERLRTARAVARPEVAEAFAAAGDTTAQVLLLPTPDCRRVAEEMIPTLPPQFGGGPVTALTRGAMWAALGIDMHPPITLRLVLRPESDEAAQAAQTVIDALFRFLGTDTSVRAAMPDAEKILASVQRTVTGERLQLTVAPELSSKVVAIVTRPLEVERQISNRIQSANHVKVIMTACITYASQHGGQWPPDLQTLVDAELVPPGFLAVNPSQPWAKVGYVYRKPALPFGEADPRGAVIHEPYDTWEQGVIVGFADGHVEFVQREAELLEALARTQRSVEE